MDELKPCPFCGAEMFLGEYQYPNGKKVWRLHGFHPDDCLFEISFYLPEHTRKRNLVRAWNRRVSNGDR